MVGPIVLAAASAGLATADMCSFSSGGSENLPLAGAGGARGPSCPACGGSRWSDGDVVCWSCRGSGGGTGRRALVRVAVRAQRPLEAVTRAK